MVGDGARGHSHTLNTRRADQKDDDDGFGVHRKHYMKYKGC